MAARAETVVATWERQANFGSIDAITLHTGSAPECTDGRRWPQATPPEQVPEKSFVDDLDDGDAKLGLRSSAYLTVAEVGAGRRRAFRPHRGTIHDGK